MNALTNILDNMTSFLIDPSHDSRTPIMQKIAWVATIILEPV